MRTHNHATRDDRLARRYEYDDHTVVAVDLPFDDERVSVDVVDVTVIVVVADGESVQETEFELPGPAETVDLNNGVLTVTIHS